MCINVALYGRGGHRWAMTERGRNQLNRGASHFEVGPSRLRWTGSEFELEVNEWEFPWPRPLKAQIRIRPAAFTNFETALDAAGRHRWGPVAPCARVTVQGSSVARAWEGHAYLDSNWGSEPIDRPFRLWDWSRAALSDGSTAVIYDVQPRVGEDRLVARRFYPDGRHVPFEPGARLTLPRTAWGIRRSTRADVGTPVAIPSVFENTPFYVRDVLQSTIHGETVLSVHESLDTDRLVSWPVRGMLPFRMPRRAG